MERMDIQIIDRAANLLDEDRPSGPRKKLITAIGFALGTILVCIYSLLM